MRVIILPILPILPVILTLTLADYSFSGFLARKSTKRKVCKEINNSLQLIYTLMSLNSDGSPVALYDKEDFEKEVTALMEARISDIDRLDSWVGNIKLHFSCLRFIEGYKKLYQKETGPFGDTDGKFSTLMDIVRLLNSEFPNPERKYDTAVSGFVAKKLAYAIKMRFRDNLSAIENDRLNQTIRVSASSRGSAESRGSAGSTGT